MTRSEHLTEEQFAQYRERRLRPDELLALEAHLAECTECREQTYRIQGATVQLRSLRAGLAEHLNYDGIVACAEGQAPAEFEQHLAECESCRAEVDDLRQFRSELAQTPRQMTTPASDRARSWRVSLAAAAGIVLIAGFTVWLFRHAQPVPITSLPRGPAPAGAPLPPDQRAALDLATSSRQLQRAPILDRLIAKRGVLLGGPSESPTFDIIGPVGTTVVSDRPVFYWKPLPGANSYVVSVFDENFEKVAVSPTLEKSEWQPEKPLPRGRILNWQVSAHAGGRTVRAPEPPAAEARFQVLPSETVDEIESAGLKHPGNHLLLAVLYAGAGALDEAAGELDQLAATDPAMAASLRASLAEIRK
jgi:hypothetical protein